VVPSTSHKLIGLHGELYFTISAVLIHLPLLTDHLPNRRCVICSRTVTLSKAGSIRGRGVVAYYEPTTGTLLSRQRGIFPNPNFRKMKRCWWDHHGVCACVRACVYPLYFFSAVRCLCKGTQQISSSQSFLFLSYLVHLLSNGVCSPIFGGGRQSCRKMNFSAHLQALRLSGIQEAPCLLLRSRGNLICPSFCYFYRLLTSYRTLQYNNSIL
jgi:hypothetical protein